MAAVYKSLNKGASNSVARDADAEKYLKTAAATGDRDSLLVLADFYAQRNRS